MPVQPWPTIILDGKVQECRANNLATDPVVLDGFKIDWGRTEYLSHTGAGTLRVEFLDRSGKLAQRMRDKRMIGAPIAALYGDGTPKFGAAMFQGRVSGAHATPDVPDPYFPDDPKARCWRVTIEAGSKLADLGQIIQPPGTWPQETMLSRAVALRGASFIAGISEFYFYPGSVDAPVWPLDVKGKSNLQLLQDMYMSMGDTFAYLPDENVCRYLHRRAYAFSAWMTRHADGIIRIVAGDHSFDTRTYRGVGIEACEVTADDGNATTIPINSAVTRVEASWKDIPNGTQDHVTVVWADEINELDRGRRTLTFTSWLGDGRWLDPVVLEVLNRGRYEGSQPKHPNVRIDTRRTGGFKSHGEAASLLMGGETQGIVYISGSQHNYYQFTAPFYAILGGSIEYRYPGWVIDVNLQWCLNTKQNTPPTWAKFTKSILWTAPPQFGSLSNSLTWYDMAFLSDGNVYNPTQP